MIAFRDASANHTSFCPSRPTGSFASISMALEEVHGVALLEQDGLGKFLIESSLEIYE